MVKEEVSVSGKDSIASGGAMAGGDYCLSLYPVVEMGRYSDRYFNPDAKSSVRVLEAPMVFKVKQSKLSQTNIQNSRD